MNDTRSTKIIDTILRKSRSFRVSGESSQPIAPRAVAITIALSVTVAFILLRCFILQIIDEDFWSTEEMQGRITLVLVVFLLLPGWVIAMVASGGVRRHVRPGSWISTRNAMFYKSADGDAISIAWKDIDSVTKRFDGMILRSKRHFIIVPIVRSGVSSLRLSYLWFVNRILEDFGRNRPEAKHFLEIQKNLMLHFLRPCVDGPWGSWINIAFCLFFPILLFVAGLPVYWKLAAGTDHVAFLLFMNVYIFSVLLSPILGILPIQIRERRVRKRLLDYFEKHIAPRLNDPMPRVERQEAMRRAGRRHRVVPFTYQTQEEVESFLSAIPPPPRRISPEVRRWFLLDGSGAFVHCFVAVFLGFFSIFFLVRTSESQLRNMRFWDWSEAGNGTVVKVDPHYKVLVQGRSEEHASDRIVFSFNDDKEKRIHEDGREFRKGTYSLGQVVPLQCFRGDCRYLRLDSKIWYEETEMLFFIFGPSLFTMACLVFAHICTYFWEGPARIRQWEEGTTCLGKVVGKFGLKTLLRCRFRDGETKEIPCWGLFGQEDNKGKPFAVMIDPDDPMLGRKIEEPIFSAIRFDKGKGELAVDQKAYRMWYLAAVLWCIVLVPIVFALVKLFG